MIYEPERQASRPSPPPLSYADPQLVRDDRDRRADGFPGQGFRRLGFGFGLGLLLLGISLAEYRSREEIQFCFAVGGFLFGAALPSIRPPRRMDN
jgi:hypothetical protein